MLPEVAIGAALMIFSWIIITYSLFLGTNHIRTAMAARHAAWLKGETGQNATAAQIESQFFYDTGLVKVENVTPVSLAGLFSDPKGDTGKFKDRGDGPYKVKVTFGITAAEVNSTTKFPFDLMKTKLPFMPDTLMDKALSVESSCQWERTGDTWTDWSSAIKGLFNEVVGQAGSALSALL